jgi:hypothetical protein
MMLTCTACVYSHTYCCSSSAIPLPVVPLVWMEDHQAADNGSSVCHHIVICCCCLLAQMLASCALHHLRKPPGER